MYVQKTTNRFDSDKHDDDDGARVKGRKDSALFPHQTKLLPPSKKYDLHVLLAWGRKFKKGKKGKGDKWILKKKYTRSLSWKNKQLVFV